MKTKPKNRKHTQTPFISIDTGNCVACWKCIEICSQNVISKINLPWHKHSKISKKDNCIGCLKCVNVCEYNALTYVC